MNVGFFPTGFMFSTRSLVKVGEWGMVTVTVSGGGGGGGGGVVGGDAASQVKLSGRPESHSGWREGQREGGGCVQVDWRRIWAAGRKLKLSCSSSCAMNEPCRNGEGLQ